LNKKKIIKDAALLLLSDLLVMRKAELISSLESHMTATERGKYFFDSRSCEILMIGLLPDANNDN
jgi:hypothetical protein